MKDLKSLCDEAREELRHQEHCGAFRHIGADDDCDPTIGLCDNSFKKLATTTMPGFA
jgi:hypothetical protein